MSIENAPADKMIKKADAETKDAPVLREYFLPEYQITVAATSLAEAIAKAAQVRDNKNI